MISRALPSFWKCYHALPQHIQKLANEKFTLFQSNPLLYSTELRAFPSNYSDYHEADAVGRRAEVCILSHWAIHYWIDGADQHVKILAIRPADV